MKKQKFFLAHKQFTLFFILALAVVGVAVFAPRNSVLLFLPSLISETSPSCRGLLDLKEYHPDECSTCRTDRSGIETDRPLQLSTCLNCPQSILVCHP